MKSYFFKTGSMLIILFALTMIELLAKDKIVFNWYAGHYNGYSLQIRATKNKPFTINWGDGTIETKVDTNYSYAFFVEHTYSPNRYYEVTIEASDIDCKFLEFHCNRLEINKLEFFGCTSLEILTCIDNQLKELDLSGCSSLWNLSCYCNQLSNLNLSGCSSLYWIWCDFNQIKNLDFSSCPALDWMDCSENQLTNLDLSNCLKLRHLSCGSNRLQLSDLYAAQLIIWKNSPPHYQSFGSQYLLPQTVSVGEELFSEQSVFDGISTQYEVSKSNVPALESDFSVVDGKLIFNVSGKFDVKMTNSAVREGYFEDLAEVLITLNVVNVDVQENNLASFNIYPNPTLDKFVVEYDGVASLILCDMFGREVLKQNINGSTEVLIDRVPKGIYCINVISDGKTIGNRKIVKQ